MVEILVDIFTTWYVILGLIAVAALVGLLFYLRSQEEED
ncbi:MAG: LPXTG cell wall anchor domain-containing protein [Gemmataceae bacterium]